MSLYIREETIVDPRHFPIRNLTRYTRIPARSRVPHFHHYLRDMEEFNENRNLGPWTPQWREM